MKIIGKLNDITNKEINIEIYNKYYKQKKEELGEIGLPEDQIVNIALVLTGKKYGINQNDIEKIINEVNDMELENEEITTATNDWDNFLEAIPEPPTEEELLSGSVKSDKEYYDGLVVQFGAFYKFKFIEPKELPDEWEGKYGPMYIFPIKLLDVRPKEMFDEIHTKKKEKIGEPLYEKGNNYALFLGASALGYFKKFWKGKTENGRPDGRTITYRKKKVGKYTVHEFKEA